MSLPEGTAELLDQLDEQAPIVSKAWNKCNRAFTDRDVNMVH